MFKPRKLGAGLAVLAATAGVGAFPAASAQAVVVTHDPVATLNADDVNLSTDSELTFDYSGDKITGGKITPRLTGTLKMGSARCYRVHLYSYDGATLLHEKHGTHYCFNSDGDRERSIDLSDVGDARTDQVVVAVEKQNNKTKEWEIKQSVKPGLALGTWIPCRSWATASTSAAPRSTRPPGSPPASRSSSGRSTVPAAPTASYNGTLHLDDIFPGCGRVELRYLNEAGKLVDTVDGATWCPTDKGYEGDTEALAATPSALISQLEVVMQSSGDRGATWADVDDVVSIGDL